MNETIRRIYELQVKLAADSLNALKQLQQSAASVDKTMKDAADTSDRWAKGLAAGFTVGALIAGVKNTIDAIDQLGKKADQLSLPLDEFQKLTFLAGQADVEIGDLTIGIKELEKSISEFGQKGAKSRRIFDALGIDPTGKSITAVLTEIAGAMEGIKDLALRSRTLLELFGRSGLAMAPLIAKGAEGIKQLAEAAGDWVTSAEGAVAQQGFFEQAMKRMEESSNSLKRAFVEGLLPELTRIIQAISGTPKAAEDFKEFGRFVGDVLKNIVLYARGAAIGIELLGKGVGALVAASEAIFNLRFGEALRIWEEFGGDVADASKEMSDFKLSLEESGPIIEANTAMVERNAAAEKRLAGALGDVTKKKKEKKESDKSAHDAARALAEQERILAEAIELGNKFILARQAAFDAMFAGTPTRKTEELQKQIDALNEAFFEGRVSLELYNEAIEGLTGKVVKVQPELSDMEKLLKEIADKVDGYSQRISGFFIDWVTGAGEAKTNFTDFAVSMLRQLAQMTVQMLVFDKLVKTVAQTVAGWNLSGGMGDMLATAQGAAFSGGHVLPLARGGVVTRPTVFAMAGGMGLMGEAGPEAVMPLKRGADGKLGVSGGSTVNVTVVNNAAGAKARTEEDRQPDGTVNVRVMIEDVVDTAFKRGRFDGSMRESFGAARRGRM